MSSVALQPSGEVECLLFGFDLAVQLSVADRFQQLLEMPARFESLGDQVIAGDEGRRVDLLLGRVAEELFTELDGIQIGAGGELYLTDNISFGLEYLYSRYDDDDAYVLVGAGTAPATNPFLLDSGETALRPSDPNLNIHSIRTTLNFRF